MSYRKLQLKLGDYERKILHIGTIKFRPELYFLQRLQENAYT